MASLCCSCCARNVLNGREMAAPAQVVTRSTVEASTGAETSNQSLHFLPLKDYPMFTDAAVHIMAESSPMHGLLEDCVPPNQYVLQRHFFAAGHTFYVFLS